MSNFTWLHSGSILYPCTRPATYKAFQSHNGTPYTRRPRTMLPSDHCLHAIQPFFFAWPFSCKLPLCCFAQRTYRRFQCTCPRKQSSQSTHGISTGSIQHPKCETRCPCTGCLAVVNHKRAQPFIVVPCHHAIRAAAEYS